MVRAGVARLRRGIVFGRSERAVRIAALAVVAANGDLVAVALTRGPADPVWAPIALGIGALALAAFLRPIEPAPGEKFSVAAAAAFFAAVVLPAPFAVGAVWSAAVAAKVVQRRSLTNTAVNAAQAAGATAAAALVLGITSVNAAGTLALAGGAYFMVTLASVGLMIVASQGLGAARAFAEREALPTAALVAAGAVAGLAWTRDPLAILLLLPVLAAIEVAVRRPARDRSATAAAEREQRQEMEAAHELRTPLAALASDLAYIRGPLPSTEASALASAREQTQRLSDLVERLLMLGKLDARLPLARAASVSVVTERVVSGVGLHERVDLHFHVEPELLAALPDDLLEVVVRDLVTNALAYTADGSVTVRGRMQGDRVEIVVSDTGIGIAPEELRHVFDRFYRGPRAAAIAPGTGLGLAIVRRIVEGYGGEIAIRSEVGRGTEVTVLLPRAAGLHDEARVDERRPSAR